LQRRLRLRTAALPVLPRSRLCLLSAVPCSARPVVSAAGPACHRAVPVLHLQGPRRLLLFAMWRNRTRSRSAGCAGVFPLGGTSTAPARAPTDFSFSRKAPGRQLSPAAVDDLRGFVLVRRASDRVAELLERPVPRSGDFSTYIGRQLAV
jgi:hypothetical protein